MTEAASVQKKHLIGLDREDMAQELGTLGLEPFRAKQLWHWVYQRGARTFEEMTTISKSTREVLAQHYTLDRPKVSRAQASRDGTQKWLLQFNDGQEAETVHIPEEDRGTVCISSQVGCTLTCKFCHTGTQLLVRNLTAHEIVGQMMVARDVFGEWPSPHDQRHISNIVMMGMGEPLYNYENVAKALRIIMDHEGISLSKRKITLSTSGVVPMMRRCGEELGVNLAISLHAVSNDIRSAIMPINKKYPLEELLQACREYHGISNSRRITFEYVLLKGINDSIGDARELVRLLRGIPAKVNLIPFNPWPNAPYERSTEKAISAFANVVMKAGYASPIRTPRGEDILAACGQLKSASERQRKSHLSAEETIAA